MSGSGDGGPLVSAGEIVDGKYRVERVLGSGGMGYVVEAWHLRLDERVALKFLRPSVAGHEGVATRFAREAQAAAKIKGEHVCRVLDVGRSPVRGPYMVMEYLEGEDLGSMVERGGPLPVAKAVTYVLQACEALAEAHERGIVHRDLKPSNLFLARRPTGQPFVKLLDFGISKSDHGPKEQRLTMTDTVMGSFAYASPEHVRNVRDVDCRTDVWALGVVLFELLTGALPFPASTQAELIAKISADAPLRLRALQPAAPAALEAVILTCLEKDRERRYRTVAELAVDLSPFAPHSQPIVGSILRIASATLAEVGRPALGPTDDMQRADDAVTVAAPPAPSPATAYQADLTQPTLPSTTEVAAQRSPDASAVAVGTLGQGLHGAAARVGESRAASWARGTPTGDTMLAAQAPKPAATGASTVAPWSPGQELAAQPSRVSRVLGASGAALAVVALALAIGFIAWPQAAPEPTAPGTTGPVVEPDAAVGGQPLAPTSLASADASARAAAAPTGSPTTGSSGQPSTRPQGETGSPRPGGKGRPAPYRYR